MEEVLPWLLIVVFWIVVFRRRAHHWQWRGLESGRPPETDAEIARLREEVERLAGQVERLTEEQSFMLRLLSEGDRRLLEQGREPGEQEPSS